MNHTHVPQMVSLSSSRDSRSSIGEGRVMQCHILLEEDLQNRVCGIVVNQQGHDGSMRRLQKVEVGRDFEFDTTGCCAQRIQQIEQCRLYVPISFLKKQP